jgi:hypothetical protein
MPPPSPPSGKEVETKIILKVQEFLLCEDYLYVSS